MTILTIMRHAKSDWGDAGLPDFDRPLNERGKKAAKRVGRELRRRRIRFDCVLASPAKRVRETLDFLAEGYGELPPAQFDERIYEAMPDTLLELVRHISNEVHSPLLVGHNPGLQQLVLNLTSDDGSGYKKTVAAKFPTAVVAVITLPAVRWDEVEPGTGQIRELILPREIGD
jgi:phosphohistidine phosphatase